MKNWRDRLLKCALKVVASFVVLTRRCLVFCTLGPRRRCIQEPVSMISARARMLLRRGLCDYGYLRCGYVWRATDDCARMVDHPSSYCARYRTPHEFGDDCVALATDMRQLVRPMLESHIVMLSHLSSTRNDAWLVCGRCRARRCARQGVQNRPGVAGWRRPERARQRWGMVGVSHRCGLQSRACDFARWRLNKVCMVR